MKKYIYSLAMAGLLLVIAGTAYADSYYWHLNWNDGNDVPHTTDLFLDGNYQYFVASNQYTRAPELWTTDTSFIWDNMRHMLTVGNISQGHIDMLAESLASKTDVNYFNQYKSDMNSAYDVLQYEIDALQVQINAMQATSTNVVQRTRAQTNISGSYTWTFPTPYQTGTIPIVVALTEDTSNTFANPHITSISNTQVTIQGKSLTYLHLISVKN